MAPRKKAEETKTKPSTTPATRRSARMTRSAAKRLNARLTELPTDAGKKRKQGKAVESKKKVKTETVSATSSESQPEVNTLEEEEDEDEDEDEANEEDAKEESTSTGDGVNKTIVIEHCFYSLALIVFGFQELGEEWFHRKVLLYMASKCHYDLSKQCIEFKTRAMQVKDGLLRAFPGISVLLNSEMVTSLQNSDKFFDNTAYRQQVCFTEDYLICHWHIPRRGCFEIREEGGETFISLRNMKRPFPPLKGLDIAKVISNIIDREPYSHFGLLLTSSYDEPTWKSESMYYYLFFSLKLQPNLGSMKESEEQNWDDAW
ncbi:hypothetical protein SADUNF_Sadunf06G0220900 [Salix dunnii]|uniref:Uncharacterized protein n=1 Tax=Salix dunnii TaxID=1413687 RepID=A0A835K8M6_9ROSI|nr:hypothetical protein SADUNF_Sadunf06G0220900 [Salix dunnii]